MCSKIDSYSVWGALGVLGVHLQIFPVNYAYNFFLRPGGAGAPIAPPLATPMHRTESVSVMDHELPKWEWFFVLDQKQQNIFGRISLFWSVELQGHPA